MLKLYKNPLLGQTLASRIICKLMRILARLRIAQHIEITFPVKIRAANFKIPVSLTVGEGNIQMGDAWAIDIFAKLLPKRDGVFLDIGANVGQTLLKLKSLFPDRPWIGFEPNPVCLAYLDKLIRTNGFRFCTLIPAALQAETGLMQLDCYGQEEADKAASLVKDFRPSQTVLARKWVSCVQYSVLQRAGVDSKVGFVKIDVEGGEKEVIESLKTALEEYRPHIMLEILPAYSADNHLRISRQRAVERYFRDIRYELFRIQKNTNDRCVGLKRIHEIEVHDKLGLSDYLAIPSEHVQSALAEFLETR